jgi:hypothetical protein
MLTEEITGHKHCLDSVADSGIQSRSLNNFKHGVAVFIYLKVSLTASGQATTYRAEHLVRDRIPADKVQLLLAIENCSTNIEAAINILDSQSESQ